MSKGKRAGGAGRSGRMSAVAAWAPILVTAAITSVLGLVSVRYLWTRDARQVTLKAESMDSMSVIGDQDSRASLSVQGVPMDRVFATGKGRPAFYMDSFEGSGNLPVSLSGLGRVAVYPYSDCPGEASEVHRGTQSVVGEEHIIIEVSPPITCVPRPLQRAILDLDVAESQVTVSDLSHGSSITIWETEHSEYYLDSEAQELLAVYLIVRNTSREVGGTYVVTGETASPSVPSGYLYTFPLPLELLGVRGPGEAGEPWVPVLAFLRQSAVDGGVESGLAVLADAGSDGVRITVSGASRLLVDSREYQIPEIVDVVLGPQAGSELGVRSLLWIEGEWGQLWTYERPAAGHEIFGSRAYVVDGVGKLHVGVDEWDLDGTGVVAVHSIPGASVAVRTGGNSEPGVLETEIDCVSHDVRLNGEQLVRTRFESYPSTVQTLIAGGGFTALAAAYGAAAKASLRRHRSAKG